MRLIIEERRSEMSYRSVESEVRLDYVLGISSLHSQPGS